MAKNGAKSGKKSGNGQFAKGPDPRRGRGPAKGAPNAGRPPDAWREACRQALADAKGLDVVKHMISGDILEQLGTDRDGKPIYGETRNGDRLGAVKFLANYAEGMPTQPIEIGEMTHEDWLDEID